MLRKYFLPALAALVILTGTACSESQEQTGNNGDTTSDNDPNLAADSVLTPFGRFHKDHVHQHPEGSVITNNEDSTTTVTSPDGTEKTVTAGASSGMTQASPSEASSSDGLPVKHAYINWARFVTPDGVEVGTYNANYIVPGSPPDSTDQTLYYFTGLEDPDSDPFVILQPVLGFNQGIGWNISSWNCCPDGQPHQANVVTGMVPGDTIFTSMVKSGSSYTITSTWKGQSSVLTVNTGSEKFNWPNASLEVYRLNSCSQTAVGPMTFFDMVMLDTEGNPISMDWDVDGNDSVCNTRLTLVDATTITIEQN